MLFNKKKIKELEETIESLNKRLEEKEKEKENLLKEYEENYLKEKEEILKNLKEKEEKLSQTEDNLKKTKEELNNLKKWVERLVKSTFEDIKELWQELKIPLEYSELQKNVTQKQKEKLEARFEQLQSWMQQLDMDISESHLYFGLWYKILGDLKEAARHLEIAAQKAVGPFVWRFLGDCYMEMGKADKAEEAYSHCLNDPKIPLYVLLNYAKACIRKKSFKEAADVLEKALKQKPKDLEYYTLASYAYGMSKQYDKAVNISHKAQELFPDEPEVYSKMIIPLARTGKMNDARLAFEKAIKLNEKFEEAYFCYGVAHMDKDDKKAEEYIQKAISIKENYSEAYYCLGVIYNKREDFKTALKYLKLATKYNPDYAEAYYAMKDSYEGLKDFEKAVTVLKKATALNPNFKM